MKRLTSAYEAARLDALAQYQQAKALPESTLDRLTALAARLFNVPIAFVSLIDDQRQFFVSRYGLNITGTARHVALCDHTLAHGEILCVPDTLADRRFVDSPLVHGYPYIRFYAGIPLTTPDGHHIGTVCLTDTQPRPPMTDADQRNLTDIAALVMDRMEVRRLKLLRHISQQRLESISATSPDAIICTDLRRGIIFWNPAATDLFGYDAKEMAGQYVAGLIPERCQIDYRNELQRLTCEDAAILQPRTLQIWGVRRDGREFPADVSFSGWLEGGERLVGMIIRDVSARHESETRLCELASLDVLTRLASRGAFMQQLEQLTEARVPYTLLMADLDGFKEINDTLGHAAGDALLCRVAEQLRQVCTDAITVARLGGDEFIVLLPAGSAGACLTAERLIVAIQTPFCHQGSAVTVGASVGIALYPEHGENASSVMAAVDLALYRSKFSGKGRYILFQPSFREAEQQRQRSEAELETAVRRQQFILHYQPRFDAGSGQLIGCEALVRWDHPARGILLPAEFIEMLVRSPLSLTLGDWIIRTAIAQVRQWQVRCPQLRVSVNLFPRQLAGNSLESVLRESTGGDAAFVDLEIDERLLTGLDHDAPAQFTAIRRSGAKCIIDHYGRSLGAISLLRHDYISGIKIDKSLTHELSTSMRVRMMFSAIAALGKSLGLSVAAEGIESAEQQIFVHSVQCDIIQGNGLSSPLTAAEFETLLSGDNDSRKLTGSR